VSCTIWLPAGVLLQSSGVLSESIVSTFTGVTGPLLCNVAVTCTLNGVPVGELVGADTETPVTFTSAWPVTFVEELPLPLSFADDGSLTCSWSTAADAVTGKVWLEGDAQVTDQEIPLAVADPDAAMDVSCTVCGFVDEVVQSGGSDTENVVSTFVGPYGPRFCRPAEAVTLNATPTAFVAGLFTVTELTLISDVAVMFVLEPLLALLLPPAGSVTCSWSIAAEAVTVKLWFEAAVQVTDQVGPVNGVAVEPASDVSWTVCGLPDDVVQSPGSVSVKVVSTFAGPYGPLLCRLAPDETLKATPAGEEAGEVSEALFTLISAVAVMFVLELPLALLFPLFGSLTCNWSTATPAVIANVWLEGVVQVTDQLAPLTFVAADVASDVSWIVCGFAEPVVQSPGRLSVNVVSAFTGP
jgi:hypothetical protein